MVVTTNEANADEKCDAEQGVGDVSDRITSATRMREGGPRLGEKAGEGGDAHCGGGKVVGSVNR